MNNSQKSLRHRSIRAFTLIEILVASTVMVVLVGIVAYIAGSVMDSWNRSSGKLSANAEARLALDLIAQDLETAVLRNNGQQWLRVENKDPADIGGPYSSDSVTLKLFAPALDRENGDGVCAIAYRLAYQSSYPNGPLTYALYRMVVDPDQTLENYLSSGFDNPASSAQGSLTGSNPDWRDATIANVSNYLVSNVVEFKILIYDASQNLPKNADEDYGITSDYRYGGSDSNAGTNVPLYADIILTVVTDQGAEMLTTRNINGSSTSILGLVPENADNVVTQNGETFIRRVYFKYSPI